MMTPLFQTAEHDLHVASAIKGIVDAKLRHRNNFALDSRALRKIVGMTFRGWR